MKNADVENFKQQASLLKNKLKFFFLSIIFFFFLVDKKQNIYSNFHTL